MFLVPRNTTSFPPDQETHEHEQLRKGLGRASFKRPDPRDGGPVRGSPLFRSGGIEEIPHDRMNVNLMGTARRPRESRRTCSVSRHAGTGEFASPEFTKGCLERPPPQRHKKAATNSHSHDPIARSAPARHSSPTYDPNIEQSPPHSVHRALTSSDRSTYVQTPPHTPQNLPKQPLDKYLSFRERLPC
jgi:hypothetical protein